MSEILRAEKEKSWGVESHLKSAVTVNKSLFLGGWGLELFKSKKISLMAGDDAKQFLVGFKMAN